MQARFTIAFLVVLALLGGCVRRQGVSRVEWTTMGTVAAVQAKPSGAANAAGEASIEVRSMFTEVETLLNAHSPESEISRLASLPDDCVLKSCNERMRPCYEAAFALQKATGGAFNPRWRGAKTLDLGAIAKGFAVDLAAEHVHAPGDVSVLVDLGGNLKSAKGAWRTGVKDPCGNGIAASVDLGEGEALATSAKYFRGDHIRDGRNGGVVENGVASVTVLCGSAMWADGLSTTLFVLGPEEGRAFLDRRLSELMGERRVEVLWILSDGRRLTYPAATRFSQ